MNISVTLETRGVGLLEKLFLFQMKGNRSESKRVYIRRCDEGQTDEGFVKLSG